MDSLLIEEETLDYVGSKSDDDMYKSLTTLSVDDSDSEHEILPDNKENSDPNVDSVDRHEVQSKSSARANNDNASANKIGYVSRSGRKGTRINFSQLR